MSRSTALTRRDAPPGPLAASDRTVEDLIAYGNANARRLAPGSAAVTALYVALIVGMVWLLQLPAGAVAAVLAAAVAAVFVGVFGWHAWGLKRLVRQSDELNLLAERGELEAAAAAQARIAASARNAFWRKLAAHDLGYYELRRGNLERALQLLSATWREAPDDRGGRHLRAAAGRNLSTAYLALGDVDAATAWLPDPAGPDLYTPEAAAAVHARRGEWERVLELTWPDVQSRLEERALRHARRCFHLMRAYALEQRGGAAASALADELEAARPAYAREYDYLTGQWPELRAFVVDRCPAPRSAPDAEGLPMARTVYVRP